MTSTAKVVSLGHRPGSPEAVRLINECRSMANRFLTDAIHELFQKNDDTLFGFAEKGAEANGRYFEAMRSLRLKKDEIIRTFLERVGQNFTRLQGGTTAETPPSGQGPVTLSLLDDAELEESLAIQSMAEKTESSCAEELSPLRNRLGSVMGGAPLESREDPLGAARLAEAYRESLRMLNADIEVRLVLYKVFDKVLLNQIEDLYSDLNALLAKNGVLPEFKLRPRPERAQAARRQEAKRAESAAGGEAAETAELLPLLRELLTQQRGGSGGGGGGSGGEEGGVPLDPNVVMTALTSLQQQIRAIQSDGQGPVSPETVRAALLGPGSSGKIARQDSDVIDLISMLFESILDDRAVPDSVRVLLARLQIPMLKVALVDRSFFSKPRHPARRLLNLLAKAGIGLDDTVGSETNPRLVEIERIVTTVLENLTDDLGLFETLAVEFEEFLAQQGERESQAARRQTVAVRTREAREQIRFAIHRKLDEFFAVQPVPEPVGELLRGPWTDVLIETRFIKDQSIWASRTRLIRDLINSVTPKNSREERLAVPPVIARIMPALRDGLASLDYSTERIDAIIAMLEPYHLAVVHGRNLPADAEEGKADAAKGNAALVAEVEARLAQAAAAERPPEPPTAEAESDEPIAEEIVLSENGVETHPIPPPSPHDEHLLQARSYEVGTWFEFRNNEGRVRRAKLTWKSTLLDECIFLDWRMRMVADLNMQQFAERLYQGTVRELHDTPLFERAMDALLGRLRRKSS